MLGKPNGSFVCCHATAAALRCLNGETLGRTVVKDDQQAERAQSMGIRDLKKTYTTHNLAPGWKMMILHFPDIFRRARIRVPRESGVRRYQYVYNTEISQSFPCDECRYWRSKYRSLSFVRQRVSRFQIHSTTEMYRLTGVGGSASVKSFSVPSLLFAIGKYPIS
jgi:hypothetical protein